jgi:hypothetical protein
MWKLSKKQGISLIEVVCTIGIISLVAGFIMTMHLSVLKIKAYNREKSKCLFALEALKEEIIHNYTYEEIRQLSVRHKNIINNDQLIVDNIKDFDLEDLVSDSRNSEKSYLEINVEDGFILKIEFRLHVLRNSKEEIYKYEFLKGNYI